MNLYKVLNVSLVSLNGRKGDDKLKAELIRPSWGILFWSGRYCAPSAASTTTNELLARSLVFTEFCLQTDPNKTTFHCYCT